MDWETKAAQGVDENLENFLGIRDLELGELYTQHYGDTPLYNYVW